MSKLTKNEHLIIDQKIKIDENKFIIRLNYMTTDDPNRNVYCITADNEILWQIDADPKRKLLPGGFDSDSYVYIELNNKSLIAHRFSGFEYQVNLETGHIEEIGWHK